MLVQGMHKYFFILLIYSNRWVNNFEQIMLCWNTNGIQINWLDNLPQQASGILHHSPVIKHAKDIKSGLY